MADEIHGSYTPQIDQVAALERLGLVRGTTPLQPTPTRQGIARDGVRLSRRSRDILQAVVSGEGAMDDPDVLRLRQLYPRSSEPEFALDEPMLPVLAKMIAEAPPSQPPSLADRVTATMIGWGHSIRRALF